jgi:hypothetical protein
VHRNLSPNGGDASCEASAPWHRRKVTCRLARLLRATLILAATACDRDQASKPESTDKPSEKAHDSSSQPGQAEAEGLCQQLCVGVKRLHCKNDPVDCEYACRQMLSIKGCEAPMLAYARCASQRAPDEWRCGEDGESELGSGACQSEENAAGQCLEALP